VHGWKIYRPCLPVTLTTSATLVLCALSIDQSP
jgi:hypothetical protein